MTLTGEHFIGFSRVSSTKTFQSINPATDEKNTPAVSDGDADLVDKAVALAHTAFASYSQTTVTERAKFLRTVAENLNANSAEIIATGMMESGLPEARVTGELGRTAGQFLAFADYIENGHHLDARIDTAQPDRQPLPKPDIRSINQPLGVVGVFGASNFPLAFSTAGGDTAAALASGCTVVVRGHNGHPLTSELTAGAIATSAQQCGLADGVFSLIQGTSYDMSYALVEHPLVKAVGFTGSTYVGRLLFDKAVSRPEPIPFYGELGSINPVVLCPNVLAEKGADIATAFVGSLTMGAGQFCTNPGLVIGIAGEDLDNFVSTALSAGEQAPEQVMLAPKIAKAYHKGIAHMVSNTGQTPIAKDSASGVNTCQFNLFKIDGAEFISNDQYQSEIFGPSGLVVACKDASEMHAVLAKVHGQLTGTIWMNDNDTDFASTVADSLSKRVGRLLFNGFPTGVEVTHAMVHGGPYPASTDSRSTSVGTMAIYRFLRPVSYQQMPQALLPMALQDKNTNGITRLINGVLSTDNV